MQENTALSNLINSYFFQNTNQISIIELLENLRKLGDVSPDLLLKTINESFQYNNKNTFKLDSYLSFIRILSDNGIINEKGTSHCLQYLKLFDILHNTSITKDENNKNINLEYNLSNTNQTSENNLDNFLKFFKEISKADYLFCDYLSQYTINDLKINEDFKLKALSPREDVEQLDVFIRYIALTQSKTSELSDRCVTFLHGLEDLRENEKNSCIMAYPITANRHLAQNINSVISLGIIEDTKKCFKEKFNMYPKIFEAYAYVSELSGIPVKFFVDNFNLKHVKPLVELSKTKDISQSEIVLMSTFCKNKIDKLLKNPKFYNIVDTFRSCLCHYLPDDKKENLDSVTFLKISKFFEFLIDHPSLAQQGSPITKEAKFLFKILTTTDIDFNFDASLKDAIYDGFFSTRKN